MRSAPRRRSKLHPQPPTFKAVVSEPAIILVEAMFSGLVLRRSLLASRLGRSSSSFGPSWSSIAFILHGRWNIVLRIETVIIKDI